jgi:hypothetical protein
VIVVEVSSDVEVANAAKTTSVQLDVGALDVTVNGKHLGVQVGQTVQRQRAHLCAR